MDRDSVTVRRSHLKLETVTLSKISQQKHKINQPSFLSSITLPFLLVLFFTFFSIIRQSRSAGRYHFLCNEIQGPLDGLLAARVEFFENINLLISSPVGLPLNNRYPISEVVSIESFQNHDEEPREKKSRRFSKGGD